MNTSRVTWKKSPVIRAMAKYLWWKSTAEALEHPGRIVAQVMNLGDYKDVSVWFMRLVKMA